MVLGVSLMLVLAYDDANSDSYQVAKRFIRESPLVRNKTGENISVSYVPSYVSRNDSIYYFAKAAGTKNEMYVMCAMYLNHARKWQLAYVTENNGQFEKLKRLK